MTPAHPSLAAFGASLTAITLAELGDKTFFMALILAARHRARHVFIGAFAALTAGALGEFPSGWRYGHNRHHAAPNVARARTFL